jgi:hypothetical protein
MRISGEFGNGTTAEYAFRPSSQTPDTRPTMSKSSSGMATLKDKLPSEPAAATIWGDGVSPAAKAAASGSPPGKAAAMTTADWGRRFGSGSRHRSITRCTSGASLAPDPLVVSVCATVCCAERLAWTSLPCCTRSPVNNSNSTSPSA